MVRKESWGLLAKAPGVGIEQKIRQERETAEWKTGSQKENVLKKVYVKQPPPPKKKANPWKRAKHIKADVHPKGGEKWENRRGTRGLGSLWMYRNLTYLLKNGAFPWAGWSLTCPLKNRQVSSLTGLIAQIPCNSHHRALTEEGPGFKVVQKLLWAVVGGLHFLHRRWLLAGHSCHFSVLPDIPSPLPVIYVLFYQSKWQSFWVRDYNFLHMYTQSSGPNLRAPCTYSKSLCDRSVRGLRGLQGENRGIWSQHGGVQETLRVLRVLPFPKLGPFSWQNQAPWHPTANLTWVLHPCLYHCCSLQLMEQNIPVFILTSIHTLLFLFLFLTRAGAVKILPTTAK